MASVPTRRLQSQITSTHNKILKTRTTQTNLSKRQAILNEQNQDDGGSRRSQSTHTDAEMSSKRWQNAAKCRSKISVDVDYQTRLIHHVSRGKNENVDTRVSLYTPGARLLAA